MFPDKHSKVARLSDTAPNGVASKIKTKPNLAPRQPELLVGVADMQKLRPQ